MSSGWRSSATCGWARRAVRARAHFYEAVIRSHARLTYDAGMALSREIRRHLDDAVLTPEVRASLQELYAVYGALKEARDARGALDFRGGEVKARIGEDGKIEGFYAVLRNDAHRLIEECMIAANVQAATALRLAKAKSLYRVHGQPEEKRVTELQKVMTALQDRRDVLRAARRRASSGSWSSGSRRGRTGRCSRVS